MLLLLLNSSTCRTIAFFFRCYLITTFFGGVTSQTLLGSWNRVGNTIRTLSFTGAIVDLSADGTTMVVAQRDYRGPLFPEFLQALTYNRTSRLWVDKGRTRSIIGDNSVKLSADGNRMIVFDKTSYKFGGGELQFYVTVYQLTSGNWVQLGSRFVLDWEAKVDISEDGSTIAILSFGVDPGVRVYKLKNSPLRWEQIGNKLQNFGYTVAISANGTTVAISSTAEGGTVRVFNFNSLQSLWKQVGSLIKVGGALSDISMSSDGTTFGISPYKFDSNSTTIIVYKFSTSLNEWTILGSEIESISKQRSNIKPKISLSGDGTTIAIADEYYETDLDIKFRPSGRVQIFKLYLAPLRWEQIGSDIVGIPERSIPTGVALSADGKTLAIAIYDDFRKDDFAVQIARVYQFTPPPCDVKWKLYNSRKDTIVGALQNGTIITRPPPCNYTNIEADISSCIPKPTTNTTVRIQLFTSDIKTLLYKTVETSPKFFLFGNKGANIHNGRIVPGTYYIVAKVNNEQRGYPTTFTIRDNGQCQ